MSDHDDRGHHRGHETSAQENAGRKPPHKDWRVWTVVLLMLAAMVAYVMTQEEAVPPGEPVQQAVPEAP